VTKIVGSGHYHGRHQRIEQDESNVELFRNDVNPYRRCSDHALGDKLASGTSCVTSRKRNFVLQGIDQATGTSRRKVTSERRDPSSSVPTQTQDLNNEPSKKEKIRTTSMGTIQARHSLNEDRNASEGRLKTWTDIQGRRSDGSGIYTCMMVRSRRDVVVEAERR
jgi:hypothetical protein